MNDSPPDGASRRRGGSLVMLSLLSIGLLFGGLAIGVAVGGVMPLPYGPASAVVAYVRAQPGAVHIIAVATFASSVPLAIYAATASARWRQLGAAGPGATIALVGGGLAAGTLGLAGVLGWVLARPELSADTALLRALYLLVFLVGGPAHIVALGLLVAGLAVPGLTCRVLPRPVAWMGVAIAALAELATVVLIWQALGPILPIARVLALAWLVLASVVAQRDSAIDRHEGAST